MLCTKIMNSIHKHIMQIGHPWPCHAFPSPTCYAPCGFQTRCCRIVHPATRNNLSTRRMVFIKLCTRHDNCVALYWLLSGSALYIIATREIYLISSVAYLQRWARGWGRKGGIGAHLRSCQVYAMSVYINRPQPVENMSALAPNPKNLLLLINPFHGISEWLTVNQLAYKCSVLKIHYCHEHMIRRNSLRIHLTSICFDEKMISDDVQSMLNAISQRTWKLLEAINGYCFLAHT